jgi:hypothetical protein
MARGGRRKLNIPWQKVDEYLRCHCTGVEIAASLGCHPQTLYEATFREKNQEWREYANEHYGAGRQLLRVAQFKKALEGHYGMLVWLGKQYLNQYDRQAIAVKNEIDIDVSKLTDEELIALQTGSITLDSIRNKQLSNSNENSGANNDEEAQIVTYDDLIATDKDRAGAAQ